MTRTPLALAAAALMLGGVSAAQAAGPAGLTLPAPNNALAVATTDAAPVIKTGVRINLHFGGGYRRGYRRCFYKRFRHRHGGYRHWHTRRVCRWY